MYLHLASGESCNTKKIVAILDIETATQSNVTKTLIKRLQDEKMTVNLTTDLPKSLVLAEDEMCETLYVTSVSPDSLKKRSRTGETL